MPPDDWLAIGGGRMLTIADVGRAVRDAPFEPVRLTRRQYRALRPQLGRGAPRLWPWQKKLAGTLFGRPIEIVDGEAGL